MFLIPYHKTFSALKEAIANGDDIPIHLIRALDGGVPVDGVVTVGSGHDCRAGYPCEGVRWSCQVRLAGGKIVAVVKE